MWCDTPASRERWDWFMQLTLRPADGVHEDVVLMNLVLVMLELPLQAQQLLIGELPWVLGLAGGESSETERSSFQKQLETIKP